MSKNILKVFHLQDLEFSMITWEERERDCSENGGPVASALAAAASWITYLCRAKGVSIF